MENATAHVRRVTLLNTTRTRAASRPIRWHDGSRRLWLHGHTYRRYHPAQHPFTGAWIRCSASFAHVPQRCVLAAPAPALIRGGHSLRGCAACVSAQLGEQRLRPLPDARQRQTASRQREQDELVAHCQRVFEHRDRLQSLLVHLQRGSSRAPQRRCQNSAEYVSARSRSRSIDWRDIRRFAAACGERWSAPRRSHWETRGI